MSIALKRYDIQLSETQFGGAIIAAGGKCIVCKTGTPDKETLYDPSTELAMANPLTPVRGKISFCVPVDRVAVDLYIQTPAGQYVVQRNVIPSGDNEIALHGFDRHQMYVIPFSIADTTAAAETQTGIVIPTTGAVQPSPLVRVTTADATQTLDVGTLSSDSGDADGFIDGVLMTTLGLVKPTLSNAGITLGVLLWTQDSANAGDEAPEQNVSMAGKQITYTLNAATDTAKGFIYLPVNLAA